MQKLEQLKEKSRVEQEKRDEQIKNDAMSPDMGLRQAWSLTFNVRTKKPSSDRNECGITKQK